MTELILLGPTAEPVDQHDTTWFQIKVVLGLDKQPEHETKTVLARQVYKSPDSK